MAFAELNDEQLVHSILSSERDLVTKRFKHSNQQLENTAQLRDLRRQVARMRTEARAREIANDLPKGNLLHTHRQSFGGGAAESADAEEKSGGFLSGIVDTLAGKE